jgi:chromosome segregation ATPase
MKVQDIRDRIKSLTEESDLDQWIQLGPAELDAPEPKNNVPSQAPTHRAQPVYESPLQGSRHYIGELRHSRMLGDLEELVMATRQMEEVLGQAQNRSGKLSATLAAEQAKTQNLTGKYQALRIEAEKKLKALADRLRSSETERERLLRQARELSQGAKAAKLEADNLRGRLEVEQKKSDADKQLLNRKIIEEKEARAKAVDDSRRADQERLAIKAEIEGHRNKTSALNRESADLTEKNKALEIKIQEKEVEIAAFRTRARSMEADLIRFRAAWGELCSKERTARRLLADAEVEVARLTQLLSEQGNWKQRHTAIDFEFQKLQKALEIARKEATEAKLGAERTRSELEKENVRLRGEMAQALNEASRDRERTVRDHGRADERLQELEKNHRKRESEFIQERTRFEAALAEERNRALILIEEEKARFEGQMQTERSHWKKILETEQGRWSAEIKRLQQLGPARDLIQLKNSQILQIKGELEKIPKNRPEYAKVENMLKAVTEQKDKLAQLVGTDSPEPELRIANNKLPPPILSPAPSPEPEAKYAKVPPPFKKPLPKAMPTPPSDSQRDKANADFLDLEGEFVEGKLPPFGDPLFKN